MNARQSRFVREYLIDGKGAAAATRAGYAAASARVTASRLLAKANVQAAIAAGRAGLEQQFKLSRERVLAELYDAVKQARAHGNAQAVIAGWREIAKICGYYAPERKRVELTAPQNATLAALEAMTDEELLAIAATKAAN